MAKANDLPPGSVAGDEPEEDDSGVTRLDTLTDDFARLLGRRRPKAGSVFAGKYRFVAHLGSGAMGEVWEATNLTIGMRVAVKLLKPELLGDAQFRSRFQREAQAIASVSHPNVARFFDVVVGDPTFLVMEFVEGRSLKDVLDREGRLDPDRALEIAAGVARALGAVHAAGVVHRDLKPSNIMIAAGADGRERPLVIDFGLAKTIRTGEELTRPGQIVGTPHYMAPEQIAGFAVDARMDVYALGCVLFHMLTGKAPFSGDSAEVLHQHVHAAAPPVAGVSGVSEALAAVVTRAMSKLSADRFRTAAELARALERLVEERKTASRSVPLARLNQRQLLLAAGALALSAFLIGVVATRRRRPETAPATAGALLVVDTRPADARVFLDGKLLDERSPAAIRGVLPGPHQVRLEHDGFAPAERDVRVEAGGRSVLTVELPPEMRRVQVRTRPPGAALFLDGVLAANSTPAEVAITNGDFHELRVERSGYETATRDVRPEDRDAVLEIELEPEKLRRGALVVDADRVGAVWIDGVDSGFVTPTLAIRVAPGRHVVELRGAGGARVAQAVVRIARGETRRLLLSGRTR